MDVTPEYGNKDVLIPVARRYRRLTGSDAAASSREKVRMKGGQSREVGSRESQREGVEERREASAREGWKGGVLVERRFFRTRSRWPREVDKD